MAKLLNFVRLLVLVGSLTRATGAVLGHLSGQIRAQKLLDSLQWSESGTNRGQPATEHDKNSLNLAEPNPQTDPNPPQSPPQQNLQSPASPGLTVLDPPTQTVYALPRPLPQRYAQLSRLSTSSLAGGMDPATQGFDDSYLRDFINRIAQQLNMDLGDPFAGLGLGGAGLLQGNGQGGQSGGAGNTGYNTGTTNKTGSQATSTKTPQPQKPPNPPSTPTNSPSAGNKTSQAAPNAEAVRNQNKVAEPPKIVQPTVTPTRTTGTVQPEQSPPVSGQKTIQPSTNLTKTEVPVRPNPQPSVPPAIGTKPTPPPSPPSPTPTPAKTPTSPPVPTPSPSPTPSPAKQTTTITQRIYNSTSQSSSTSPNKVTTTQSYSYTSSSGNNPGISSPTTTTPIKKQIVNREFSNVGLYHEIPSSFMTGEFFRFNGLVLNPNTLISQGLFKYNYINIVFNQWGGNKNQFRCVQEMSMKSMEFQISCKMQSAGRFFVSIFPGASGQSSVNTRSVRNSSIFMSATEFTLPSQIKPVNLAADVVDNRLQIQWQTQAPLTNLTIYQKSSTNKKQYLLSNHHSKFLVPFADFQNFQPTTTIVQICHSNSEDGTLYQIAAPFSRELTRISFEALDHGFDRVNEENVKIVPDIPWRVRVGQKFRFDAMFKEDIRNQVFIVLPNRDIAKVNFTRSLPANATVRAGTPLDLELTLSMPGTHILEINGANGMAVVNRPIYVGEGLPLIPDHEDLISPASSKQDLTSPKQILSAYIAKQTSSELKPQPEISASVDSKRDFLLFLLNNLRKLHKAGPLYLDQKLTTIAQYFADDMNRYSYFDHTSPNGDGPGQRARRFGFNGSIGENIAQSNSLAEAHLGLERSADHLENSIKPGWTRVGIGISRNRQGQYLVAFEFSERDLSVYPLTPSQISSYSSQIVQQVISKNPNIKSQNKQLSQDIQSWLSNPQGTKLFDYLFSKDRYYGAMSYTSFTVSYSQDVIQRIRDADYFKPTSGSSRFREVGIGLAVKRDQPEILEGYVVYM